MIYEKLLRLPLFTGMSLDELQSIMGKTKIDFSRAEAGSVITRQGARCGVLLIMTHGEAAATTTAYDGSYSLTETVTAPAIIQQEGIFGRFQEFTRTLTATTQVSTMTIGKPEVQKLAEHSLIFRLNLLGSLSTTIQKDNQELWRNGHPTLEARIVSFFRRRCLTLTGKKSFKIKMLTLADIVNDSRLDVSHALNNLQRAGLVKLSRGRVDIPDMHRLITESA